MTPEEKAILENTYALVKENHEILLSIRRRARYGTVLKIFYWTLIIGASFGTLYFIQPYIDMIKGVSNNSPTESTSDYAKTLQDLLK
jgi:hypothetical protein